MKIGCLCEKASMKNGIFPMTQSLILQSYFSSKMPICQTDTVLSFRASAHKAHGHCPWQLGHQSLETSVPTQCVHHEKGTSSPPLLSFTYTKLSPISLLMEDSFISISQKKQPRIFFFPNSLALNDSRTPHQALADPPMEPSETSIRHVVTACKLMISQLSGLSLP